MRHALLRVLVPVAAACVACAPGSPRGDRDAATGRHVQPKHDEILGPAAVSVLLLGTYELPAAVPDAEIDVVVEKLREFAPTKIAVGVPAAKQDKLDEHFRAYLGRGRKPGSSALDRVALRLAQALGHKRVWAVDAPEGETPPVDVAGWAAAHGQADRLDGEIVQRYDEWFARERRDQASETVEDNLVWLNDPRRLAAAHGRKLVGEFEVGAGTEYPGADALAGWYNHSLRVFANLRRVASQDGERLLVVIDSAYVPLLRQAVDASPQYDLVEVNAFLGVPQFAERQVVPLL